MPKRSDVQTKSLKAFTLRLHDETAEAFEKARGNRTIQEAGEDAIRDWIRQVNDPGMGADPETWDSFREILVSAVTEELRGRPDWAEAALKRTMLMDESVSIYLQRVNHFHYEKLELGSRFVPWLVERVLHHLKGYNEVCLAIESGTTLKAILDALGPAFYKHPGIQAAEPGRIQIITNNFPGAESYESFAHQKDRAVRGKPLAEVVPCHLVPGRALREYSAVVGDRAERYLKEFCERPGDKKKSKIRLGLVVGNWIMLEGSPARPTPLARGDGHKPFKEAVLANCDEVFLISPLCKIIVVPPGRTARERLADFNKDLQGNDPDGKGDYFWVEVPDSSKLRLVTTARLHDKSIVKGHSLVVNDRVGVFRTDTDIEIQQADTPFEKLHHLVYRYDAASTKTPEEQLREELPHKRTREEAFRRKYFNI